jgi:hypothetical protein
MLQPSRFKKNKKTKYCVTYIASKPVTKPPAKKPAQLKTHLENTVMESPIFEPVGINKRLRN